MRRPSVTFINRVYAPGRGATGRVLRDLARSFAKQGWQVSVITTGPKAGIEHDGGVRVIRLKGPAKPRNALSYGWVWLKLFVAALRQRAPDLLVTQSDPPLLAVLGHWVSRIKKSRHIHWCHDIYPDLFPVLGFKFPAFVRARMDAMSKAALEKADKVIVIGRCMANALTDSGLDAKSITIIPNWPDLALCKTAAQEATADAAARGLPPEKRWYSGAKPFEEQIKDQPKFRVLYAGNIGLAHPVDTILDAAEILNTENPEIEFVFVGDGPRFDTLARERTQRGLTNIRLMPYQPQKHLRSVMESGDLHLVSLKEEAAGLAVPSKIYAAFAAQRPCLFVGPHDCEAADVIRDFKAGAVVSQNDAQALAAQIKHYRYSGDDWFAAQKGAAEAGAVFTPAQAISAWIDRAWAVIKPDAKAHDFGRPKRRTRRGKAKAETQGATKLQESAPAQNYEREKEVA
ncbi:MAG: glycosyltransferase family 4 protein [Alphaproteobacteria bacterium]|nr:glycosyltransferase family 4 protein [Alphaproteobacteria bacterium]